MNSGQDAVGCKSEMNESRLDEDLKALGKSPPPPLPTDFYAAVWSKIQNRETTIRGKPRNWLEGLFVTLATPQWAAAALVLALLIGWSLGRITTRRADCCCERYNREQRGCQCHRERPAHQQTGASRKVRIVALT
jgi:hypothetical protein